MDPTTRRRWSASLKDTRRRRRRRASWKGGAACDGVGSQQGGGDPLPAGRLPTRWQVGRRAAASKIMMKPRGGRVACMYSNRCRLKSSSIDAARLRVATGPLMPPISEQRQVRVDRLVVVVLRSGETESLGDPGPGAERAMQMRFTRAMFPAMMYIMTMADGKMMPRLRAIALKPPTSQR